MKKLVLNILFTLLCVAGLCQPQQESNAAVLKEQEKNLNGWQQGLYDVGVRLDKDSLKISPESKKIMQDSAYRQVLYPQMYTWAKAVDLLKQTELKKAFWHLIKLYQKDTANKRLVLQSLLPFDKSVDMEKALISTFYTYALLDPEVCAFKNNRVMITRPDMLEKEFRDVKEMVGYIRAQRGMAPKVK